jgi:hypothetical protein
MALNKLSRALSLPPGEASKILPKEVVAMANEQRRIVEKGGGKKGKKS